jgi:putative PEP-CTERM system histidine kinase
MFSLYDLAEIGACFAAFFSMLFVLVRKPGHVSAHLFVVASISTVLLWVAYILIIPRFVALQLWQQGILTSVLAVTSALWLLFELVFARESAFAGIRDRAFTVYALMTLFAASAVASFFTPIFQLQIDEARTRFIHFTQLGKYFLVLLIISYTFGLFQLESTYRASVGQLRRALRPAAISTATLQGVLLIAAMLGLLIARIDFVAIQLAALCSIVTLVMVSRFLVFEEVTGQRVVISREAVYSSVAVLLVGTYFVLIGVTVWILIMLGGSPKVFFSVLAAFMAILLFVALFFSSSIKTRWRGLVDRSIYSGKIDLLAEMSAFAEQVSVVTDRHEMFDSIVAVLEQKCQMSDIVIALKGEQRGEFHIDYPVANARTVLLPTVEDWLFRAGLMLGREEIAPYLGDCLPEERIFVETQLGDNLIPLLARKELVGFVSCRAGAAVSSDVRFLVDSISHQLALSLLSSQQSEKLLETRELASFTKVSSFVIHDVKNLISMLSMVLQNAETKLGDPRFQSMTIETLRGAQERMQRLISRLTSPAKQADVKLSDCDLRRLVLDLCDEMRLSGQKKIAVRIGLEELPAVKGNPDGLKSVVSNLFINAIEAMPDGGDLLIDARVDDMYVVMTVRDTGVGMSPDFLREKLFRPFQTSKPSGLGIGLFQSKELVEQMNGKLTVDSVLGEGTCFTMKLRRA